MRWSIDILLLVKIVKNFAEVLQPLWVLADHPPSVHKGTKSRAAVRVDLCGVVQHRKDNLATAHLARTTPEAFHNPSAQLVASAHRWPSPLVAKGSDRNGLCGNGFLLILGRKVRGAARMSLALPIARLVAYSQALRIAVLTV